MLGGNRSLSGVNVNEETSLKFSVVFASINNISQDISTVSTFLYGRNKKDERFKARDHPLYNILHDEPNSEMDDVTFKKLIMVHILAWGNFYAEIQYRKDGSIKALWPLNPSNTSKIRNPKNKKLYFRTILPNGKCVTLPEYRVLHCFGFTLDGLEGVSVLTFARESIGLGLAGEIFANKFFSNGATPGGVITHPNKLGDKARINMKKSWNEMHQGLDNAARIAILEEGVEFKSIGIPQKDAQFLETRQFQAKDVARFYRMPPHKVGIMDNATFSNIEHQSIEYVTDTLRPWTKGIEKAMKRQLLLSSEKSRYFIEFNLNELVKGDIKTRYESYHKALNAGWMNIDEVRQKENMNPAGLNIHLANGNLRSVKALSEAKVESKSVSGGGVKTE